MRQLAAFLHAERDEMGNWWFDRAVVQEHAEARAKSVRGVVAIERLDAIEQDLLDLTSVLIALKVRVDRLETQQSAEPQEGEE